MLQSDLMELIQYAAWAKTSLKNIREPVQSTDRFLVFYRRIPLY